MGKLSIGMFVSISGRAIFFFGGSDSISSVAGCGAGCLSLSISVSFRHTSSLSALGGQAAEVLESGT